MAGEKTSAAILEQPEWLRRVRVDDQLPAERRVLFTGCGTSFHAAQTGGDAVQALELVLQPERAADVLVCVSHEGTTPLTIEAAEAWAGETWAVTSVESPIAAACDHVVWAPGPPEESWCHTRSYTCAVATLAALRGEDISWLADAVAAELDREPIAVSQHERWLVAGAGRDWPTAQEAVLKLREGAFVAAEAHQTEQLLHGHLAAIDERVRAFVLEGEGRAGDRAQDAVAALTELGCEVELVSTRHPVVDIVRFQRLTVDLAESRGVDPDRIRTDDPRWKRAREAYA
jgi:glutamine---fructose-6-phosphate transaminase (isomerizing)